MDTTTPAPPSIRIYEDYTTALHEFVVTPVADRLGLSGEDVMRLYDVELLFNQFVHWDSINGREGFRRARNFNDDLFWTVVAHQKY